MTPLYTRDPEFLRQLNIVPFDLEADLAAERDRVSQAAYMFRLAQEKRDSIRILRAILVSVLVSILIWIGAVAWLSL